MSAQISEMLTHFTLIKLQTQLGEEPGEQEKL